MARQKGPNTCLASTEEIVAAVVIVSQSLIFYKPFLPRHLDSHRNVLFWSVAVGELYVDT